MIEPSPGLAWRPLEGPERLLVDEIATVHSQRQQWPTHQWLEALLGKDGYYLDEVLAGLPAIDWYGYCWGGKGQGAVAPSPDSRIGLTIAGLAVHGGRDGTVREFLRLLRTLCHLRIRLVADPVDVSDVVITDPQLQAALSVTAPLAGLLPLLEHEPATMRLRRVVEDGKEVGYRLTGSDQLLRRFASVETVQDYLEMTAAVLAPTRASTVPALPDTALHTALDMLDLVWRLHRINDGKPLLRITSAERVARLAEAPATVDELAARLAGLTDVLEKLDTDRWEGRHALEKLRAALIARVEPGGLDRVNNAINALDYIRVLRNGLTHSGRAPVGAYTAARELGLSWPPSNPPEAWHRIVGQAVEAVDRIRDELDLSHD